MSETAFELSLTTTSAEQTRTLGCRLGPLLVPGDVVLLGGDLGAGKTTFTQGLAWAMGIKEQVTSPTFTLVHAYDNAPGQLKLLHADVYRLEHLQEVIDLGLPELCEEGAAVVEWGDKAAPAMAADYLEIRFGFCDADDDRRLVVRPVGQRWAARFPTLKRALRAEPEAPS